MKHTNLDNEIGEYKEPDRSWKFTAIVIATMFIGWIAFRGLVTWIWGV